MKIDTLVALALEGLITPVAAQKRLRNRIAFCNARIDAELAKRQTLMDLQVVVETMIAERKGRREKRRRSGGTESV